MGAILRSWHRSHIGVRVDPWVQTAAVSTHGLTHLDVAAHRAATRQGAAGFLVKDTPPAEILRAIELVASGESMLSPTVTRRLIDHLAADGQGDERRRRAELHLSVATIKSHVSAMLATPQLDNRVQLALMVQDARRA